MNRKRSKKGTRIAQTFLIAVVLCSFPVAWTQEENLDAHQAAPSASRAARQKPAVDGAHQGIKIHGHWTIEVRNPDGRVATHREFENAYSAGTPGSPNTALSKILARQNSVGSWAIRLDAGGASPCFLMVATVGNTLTNSPEPCFILEPLQSGDTADFPTLTVSANAGALVLSGNFTAPASGTINAVNTVISPCDASRPAGQACLGPALLPFTSATLAPGSSNPPINVLLGQTVQVTVIISFS